jgi:alkylation response protein AidB-like acyl-CoA dehydrogenase
MSDSESDHIRMLRETLQHFIAREAPRDAAAKWDKENVFPRKVFVQLAELGVMGLTIPEAYGGSGRDILATMIVIEELSRRSLALAVPYIMAACYAGMNMLDCGSETQKRALLPDIAAGKVLFSYGWSEPNVGSDLASVTTHAQRQDGHLIINGAKRFCSGALFCDYIYTLVRTGPTENRRTNLSFVLIPPSAAGVIIEPIETMGMKGTATTDVTFVDVKVPVTNLVGGENGWNRGWEMITGTGLDVEKLEVAAMALGIASAAFDDAWEYSLQRRQFGKQIAAYQTIRHKLADMRTQLHASRLMLYDAARRCNALERCGIETSMTKLFVTEAAKNVVLECQTILGAYGYVRSFDVERYVRDVLLMPIIGGSSAIQRNNIANWSGLDNSSP